MPHSRKETVNIVDKIARGVYTASKNNGEVYYRASFTYKNKHISLGSSLSYEEAAKKYEYASGLINDNDRGIDDYDEKCPLSFDKYVLIVNYRDNNIYLSNPIYVRKKYFSYYLSPNEEMKFSMDDLFYYMSHKIQKRGGHLFVSDYGMQLSLGVRYGMKPYSVAGKDHNFINGDELDYRYENIEVLNTYQGVEQCMHKKKNCYRTKIHIRSNIVVGYYDDAVTAAIAYNKAVDILKRNGIDKNFAVNYIDNISNKVYADIYSSVSVSKLLFDLA